MSFHLLVAAPLCNFVGSPPSPLMGTIHNDGNIAVMELPKPLLLRKRTMASVCSSPMAAVGNDSNGEMV